MDCYVCLALGFGDVIWNALVVLGVRGMQQIAGA
jgi:hypothetical protein